MRRRASTGIALLALSHLVFANVSSARAQAGSVDGTIGKQDNSISGGEAADRLRTVPHPRRPAANARETSLGHSCRSIAGTWVELGLRPVRAERYWIQCRRHDHAPNQQGHVVLRERTIHSCMDGVRPARALQAVGQRQAAHQDRRRQHVVLPWRCCSASRELTLVRALRPRKQNVLFRSDLT